MDFGVTVLRDPPFSRRLELIQLAEQHGFGAHGQAETLQAFADAIIPELQEVPA
ncbi:MAG: hypothetical protein QOG85_1556 [Gaiellaceae bacterium]|jgi:hypothetical protein|nr:hypothetical protein [Gaiellaceae bacterium]